MSYFYHNIILDESLKSDPYIQTISPVLLEILVGRGFDTVEKIREFLTGDMDDIFRNLPMKDSDIAVEILKNAVEQGEMIAVYRDYDCDGCSAAAVAVESLVSLGGQVIHYGNERSLDGYGICKNGIDQILRYFPHTKVILTVDNGIVAYDAIKYAKSRGLKVVVTDHHEMGEDLPQADAVVDPKRRDEFCRFRDLCGAGVIFKVMLSLYEAMNQDFTPVLRTIDLVALATVADIMPLVGENRIIVREGLRRMNQMERPFFREVSKQQNLKEISAHSELGFQIGPLINAPSRMGGDVSVAVTAMLGAMGSELEQNVAYLKNLNDNRKKETEAAHAKAKKELELQQINSEQDSAILLVCPEVSDGLVGLVAGRLSNRHHKIVGIFHENQNGFLKGSMRGVEGFHIKEALDQISDGLLFQYGGHSKAAGLSLLPENFDKFKEEFVNLVEKAFPDGPGKKQITVDARIQEQDCTLELADCLRQLEPFGEGFREPVLELHMDIQDVKFMGSDQQHVAYVGPSGLRAIRWKFGENERENPNTTGIFYGTVEENVWNGRSSPQFKCT